MHWVVSFILFLSISFGPLYAQPADSLKRLLEQSDIMVEKIDLNQQLAKHYERSSRDTALLHIDEAERLFENYQNDSLYLKVISQKVQLLVLQRKISEAENLLDKLEALIGSDTTGIQFAKLLFQRGNIHLHQQEFDQALNFYLKGLGHIDEQAEPLEALRFYNNISIIYIQLRKPQQAQEYLEKAVALHLEPDQLRLTLLSNLAALYQENKSESKALEILKEAEGLALDLNHQPYLALQYTNFSNVYLKLNRLDEAIEYAGKSLEIKQKNQLPGVVAALNNLGYAYFLKDEFEPAIDYFQEALPQAKGKESLQVLLNLKNAYQGLGQPAKSLEYFDEYTKLKDSIDAQEYDQKVAEISEKYEAEKKEQQIQLLQADNELQDTRISRQRYILTAVALFSLLVLATGYLLMRQNKIRQTLQNTLLKQRFLRMQLNPHFIFNALNSVQNYLYKNESEKSIEYLGSFSHLMRGLLETSDQEWVPIANDTAMLESYLQLQQLQTPFDFKIAIDQQLNSESVLVPTMLTQPFVENAIVHGLKNQKNGRIDINYQKHDTLLRITIVDNGSGIKQKASHSSKELHRSMSSDIISERMTSLQNTFGIKTRLEISNHNGAAPYPGTKVLLEFPFNEEKL